MSAISVIGVGTMGSRIADGLAEQGHSIAVWGRDPVRTAEVCAAHGWRHALSIADAVSASDVVLTCVRDDEASTAVGLGADPPCGTCCGTLPRGEHDLA